MSSPSGPEVERSQVEQAAEGRSEDNPRQRATASALTRSVPKSQHQGDAPPSVRLGLATRCVARWTLVVLVMAGVCGSPRLALARSEVVIQYTLQQAFSAALRYVRVELGFEVVERDPEAAYLLFKYEEGAPTRRVVDAAIEVVDTEDGVRVIVRIPAMPSFHERVLQDALLKKLESDYGSPPPKAKPSPAKKAPAAGAKPGNGATEGSSTE